MSRCGHFPTRERKILHEHFLVFLLIRTAYVRPLIHVLDGLRKRCGRAVARVGITSKLRKYEG